MFKWCPRLKLVKSRQILALLLRKTHVWSGFIHVKSQNMNSFHIYMPNETALGNSPGFGWCLDQPKRPCWIPSPKLQWNRPLDIRKTKKNIEKARKSTQNPWKSTQKIVKRQVKSSNSQCVPPVSFHRWVSTWFRKDATNNGVSFAGVAPFRSAPREI